MTVVAGLGTGELELSSFLLLLLVLRLLVSLPLVHPRLHHRSVGLSALPACQKIIDSKLLQRNRSQADDVKAKVFRLPLQPLVGAEQPLYVCVACLPPFNLSGVSWWSNPCRVRLLVTSLHLLQIQCAVGWLVVLPALSLRASRALVVDGLPLAALRRQSHPARPCVASPPRPARLGKSLLERVLFRSSLSGRA